MDINAKITGIKYKPFLVTPLKTYKFDREELSKKRDAKFLLELDNNQILAISKWTSSKRSRSYPLSNVYNILDYQYRKVTIIPIYKDEGLGGDKDFLEWDIISLMSLLGVYTIIAYYLDAVINKRKPNKITTQVFDYNHIMNEINKLKEYQSDALHWNLQQLDNAAELNIKALDNYEKISKKLNIKMHSKEYTERRIKELLKGKEYFIDFSRKLAKGAQQREIQTIQPKEKLTGEKASITIKNYLGGHYYFTVDEIEMQNSKLFLIEGKHTKKDMLPTKGDIKEGLVKMLLFTNLEDVKLNDEIYEIKPVLKLTSIFEFDFNKLSLSRIKMLKLLKEEAIYNKFDVTINDINIFDLPL